MTKLKRGVSVERTYDSLKKKIIKQDLKPGELLDEKLLMKEMGVGRTPLRQAILLLKNENFIKGKPNQSSYIKELSLDEVKELYETLVILEKNIAYLAALRIEDHELENIRKIQKDHDRAIKKAQSTLNPKSQEKACWEFTDLNFEFHRQIAMVCKNRFLYKTHQNIRSQAERFSYITFLRQRSKNGETNEYYLDISKQHHEIIKCLENRDYERIGDVVVNHVKYFQNQIINSMLNIFYA